MVTTSYENKNDKEDKKIVFEAFPGDVKKPKKSGSNKIILIIFILIILFVGSSFLNDYFLKRKSNYAYRTLNVLTKNYANVGDINKLSLIRRIGFLKVGQRQKQKDGEIYLTIYGENKKSNGGHDLIDVYYDDYNNVVAVYLSLSYEKSKFSYGKASSDCNNIIKNFFNLTTTNNMISETMKNGYYDLNDENNKLNASYNLILKDKDNYVLKITVSK